MYFLPFAALDLARLYCRRRLRCGGATRNHPQLNAVVLAETTINNHESRSIDTALCDEVLARTHVPMQIEAKARSLGFVDTRLMFYHYHALPPMLEKSVPQLFRRESMEMEDPHDWRGHVMASAFILVGTRA